ncbi:hypothetical protein THIX_30181 [Thiomonas sp. X19]|nr:hypothetical protein THIX_30181 [Thiomonas sp. X19]
MLSLIDVVYLVACIATLYAAQLQSELAARAAWS